MLSIVNYNTSASSSSLAVLITTEPILREASLKRLTWLYFALGVLIQFVVVPRLTTHTLTLADFASHYIPSWLAPVNWAVSLFLIAICEGPLLTPKYLSIALNVLLLVSILFFLGSWHFHPSVSPVISVLAYIEMYWLIPRSEAKWNSVAAPKY